MELIRLKVNSQYRPCVDEAPYFSWVITSDEKNVMQTSYHITVKNMAEVMWDSGMVFLWSTPGNHYKVSVTTTGQWK